MYIILNSRLQRVGTLSDVNDGGTPYYNDLITQQIADDDQELTLQAVPSDTVAFDKNGNSKNWGHTLNQIFVPYGYPDTDKIKQGNSLAYRDPNSGHWYVMRLTSVTDSTDVSGAHYKQASGVNLAIWKLSKTVHYAETLEDASSTRAFASLFDGTGWYVNPNSDVVGGSSDITFDGQSSSQAQLQHLCQVYGAEVDAYILFPESYKQNGKYYSSDFHVALKRVDIKRHLGTDRGSRIVYGRNATNIRRSVVDDNLYTRLYVYGQNGATCSCPLTHNKPYVEDPEANEQYNPPLEDSATNFLEGAVTSPTLQNSERLAEWGLRQLKIFNHPRANYTVTATTGLNAGNGNRVVTDANLGDTFRVLDYKMDPVLTVRARVIRKQLSFANPYQNQIVLGEYTTVNVVPPAFIRNLQQGETNHVNEILDEIKRNPSALTCHIDKPDGVSWSKDEPQKKFIAHVSVLGEDISNLIQTKGWIWELRQKGQLNKKFVKEHASDGQVLVIKNDVKFEPDTYNPKADDDNSSYHNPSDSSSSDNNNDNGSDDDAPFGDSFDVYNVEEAMNGTDDITGEVRLVIDTDYISDKQNTNFNTSRIKHLFTVGEWTDTWGDPRVGALQYVNRNPQTNHYLASLVYYGRNRPRRAHHKKKNGGGAYGPLIWGQQNYDPSNISTIVERKSHTEITRLDSSGNYMDSMIIPFSLHNSNFGLDYTSDPDKPYIWTVIQDYWSPQSRYWIVRMPYVPDYVMKLSDSQVQKVRSYDEYSCMVNYDNSSGILLVSHDNYQASPAHKVDFYKSGDLLNDGQNAKPVHTINLTDYGFDPKEDLYSMKGDDPSQSSYGMDDSSSQQTFQSGCLHYPYYFFDSGNMNMSDPRMVYCINIKDGTKIFGKNLDMNDFNLSAPNNVIGNDPGQYVFAEPETINWSNDDKGNLVFLFGLNVGYTNDKEDNNYSFDAEGIPQPNYKHFEQLYQVGFDIHGGTDDTSNDNQPDHTHGRPHI